MEKPTILYQNAAKRILRYIKGTLDFGLIYTRDNKNNMITGYLDSDLAGHVEDRKSTGGMVFYLNESLVTWVSQKQRCVALSSCEAEFIAETAAACQAIWLRNLLTRITGEELGPVMLYIDNKSTIDLAENPVFHERIHVRYHFIRECVERGEVIVKHIRSELQRANVLTKDLVTVKFERMRHLLGVRNVDKTSLD
ncbi:secreted RxLR effector protein 161-like [Apium graveolens]|uniref:secreted RxLR effector protein 161-like n=1 Tax=Apium graveolens TaxID=4045 RepID=UPI003D7B3B0D